jgi:hypothetical protein
MRGPTLDADSTGASKGVVDHESSRLAEARLIEFSTNLAKHFVESLAITEVGIVLDRGDGRLEVGVVKRQDRHARTVPTSTSRRFLY